MEAQLEHLIHAVQKTVEPRRRAVVSLLEGQSAAEAVEPLTSVHDEILSLPQDDSGRVVVNLYGEVTTGVDVGYELGELKKDLAYLEGGQGALFGAMAQETGGGFDREVESVAEFLRSSDTRVFVTDRDGTINNYCARYSTSVQSIYNAVFVTRFAGTLDPHRSVVLTSAPLLAGGLADVATAPTGAFILAGSKGREYQDHNGSVIRYEIDGKQQEKLDALNLRLEQLLRRPEYRQFAYIGSGLQFKYGQSTVARQDYQGSIPPERSEALLAKVFSILQDIDPGDRFFRVEDTGKDIEISLTLPRASGTRRLSEFDKGQGLRFLDESLQLDITSGGVLICGDTHSDVPMVRYVAERTRDFKTIFVSAGDELQERVRQVAPETLFVSSPDVLVCAMEKSVESAQNS